MIEECTCPKGECFDPAKGCVGSAPDAGSDAGAAGLCTSTGGTVAMGSCCKSQSGFPNSCTVGACTCSPSSSHMIEECSCPTGKCFDPAKGCN
jgi:hypothetical protein